MGRTNYTSLAEVSQANPFVNSLGMKFMPVTRTKVLFSIWETRVQDYRAYADANSGVDKSWRSPDFQGKQVTPTDDCPVVSVSWDDAQAFCKWLSQKEGRTYRLPTVAEWSQAAGSTKYPWGDEYPPTGRAGNYADKTAGLAFSSWTVIEGYDDGYATTSPVGKFAANQYGIYDLGGNVWEWCEDWSDNRQKLHVLCGAAWGSVRSDVLLSSNHNDAPANGHSNGYGFRVVLVK